MDKIPEFKDIEAAHLRIKRFIHKTPVLTSNSINKMVESNVFFKCENFQKAGAFKYRGATNSVLSLSEDKAKKGVATHSSGNHAAALALAAKIRNIKCYIVMPENAIPVKIDAVRSYGAEITFCKPALESRQQTLDKLIDKNGAVYIPSYNYFDVICGQGTAAKELIEEVKGLQYILIPVGGGGILSGSAIAAKAINKSIKIIGVEPANADDAYRSFKSGRLIPSLNPNTIADGLLTSLGDLTFEIIRKKADDIITVTEKSIINAMKIIWERMKIIVEPSAAVTLAAILENRYIFKNKKTGVILTGGNVDLENLPFSLPSYRR
jgi:threonine dehydratase